MRIKEQETRLTLQEHDDDDDDDDDDVRNEWWQPCSLSECCRCISRENLRNTMKSVNQYDV